MKSSIITKIRTSFSTKFQPFPSYIAVAYIMFQPPEKFIVGMQITSVLLLYFSDIKLHRFDASVHCELKWWNWENL